MSADKCRSQLEFGHFIGSPCHLLRNKQNIVLPRTFFLKRFVFETSGVRGTRENTACNLYRKTLIGRYYARCTNLFRLIISSGMNSHEPARPFSRTRNETPRLIKPPPVKLINGAGWRAASNLKRSRSAGWQRDLSFSLSRWSFERSASRLIRALLTKDSRKRFRTVWRAQGAVVCTH